MLPIKPGLFRLNRKFFAFELSASKWLLVQVKAGGHPKAIWAVTNPWLIMHLFWGIIHDNSSTILFFSGVIMTHYGNFYQLDRGCWTLLAGDKHAQSKTRSIFPTICGWWISRGSQGFSRCRRWWRSLPTSWCSCAFWDSWCILGAFLVHSDAQEPEGVACTSCSARLQPFQDLPRTHSIYGSASTRGLDRSHSQSCLWRYVPLLPDFPVDWAASKPAISEHFETMHSSTYSLLSQGAWVGSFYVQISLVLWHQSGSGWYSQDWPGWHIGHSAQTSSLALAARCW